MLKRLYDKSKIWFAVAWIAAYCVLMSVGDALSATLGVEKSVTLAIALALSVILFVFLKKNGLLSSYGLRRSHSSARSMLYYVPIILMLALNLWGGFELKYGVIEAVLYVLAMLCVGFLEEIIFRGLLFEAMRVDNVKAAVIVSSVTFGIGHIINLINGSGAQLASNLLQVVYATAAGFMFVMMYCKSGSLIMCIVGHGVFNALSVFGQESDAAESILPSILLAVITASYAIYLAYSMRKDVNK